MPLCRGLGARRDPPGVVKLRRGLTAKVFGNCDDMGDLCCWLIKFLELLRCKAGAMESGATWGGGPVKQNTLENCLVPPRSLAS